MSPAPNIAVSHISDGVHIFREALRQYIDQMEVDEDTHWYLRWIEDEHVS